MIERETKRINFSPFVTMCLQEGGYIAGGAARALFLRKDMEDYFQVGKHRPKTAIVPIDKKIRLRFPSTTKPAGDVDIFFRTRSQFDAAVARADHERLAERKYSSLLSRTYEIKVAGSNDTINVQLVHCIFGPPEDMISGFDIVNCSIAVNADGFVYDSSLSSLESKSTLKIRRGDSTQLLRRIAKYMSFRDLGNLDDCTHDIVTEWLLRYVSNDFVGPASHLSSKPGEAMLALLMRQGAIERNQLIYLLNRSEFTRNVFSSVDGSYEIVGRRDMINDLIGKSS